MVLRRLATRPRVCLGDPVAAYISVQCADGGGAVLGVGAALAASSKVLQVIRGTLSTLLVGGERPASVRGHRGSRGNKLGGREGAEGVGSKAPLVSGKHQEKSSAGEGRCMSVEGCCVLSGDQSEEFQGWVAWGRRSVGMRSTGAQRSGVTDSAGAAGAAGAALELHQAAPAEVGCSSFQ